jgi:hypothetical protein
VADGLPDVTAGLLTVWVSVALGPAVVPVATPPPGLSVAIAGNVAAFVEIELSAAVELVSIAPCSYDDTAPVVAVCEL